MFSLRIFALTAAALLVALFTISNHTPVALTLFPLPYRFETQVSLLTLASFMAGAVVGGLVVSLRVLSTQARLRRAKKTIKRLETTSHTPHTALPST